MLLDLAGAEEMIDVYMRRGISKDNYPVTTLDFLQSRLNALEDKYGTIYGASLKADELQARVDAYLLEYQELIAEIGSSARTEGVISIFDSATEAYKKRSSGEGGWTFGYMDFSGSFTPFTGRGISTTPPNQYYLSKTDGGRPRWGVNEIVATLTEFPVAYWEAPEDTVAVIDISVFGEQNMISNMNSSDGMYFYAAVGGMPFKLQQGRLIPNTETVVWSSYVRGLVQKDGVSLIVELKAGERIYFGASPNANVSQDAMIADISITMVKNISKPEDMTAKEFFDYTAFLSQAMYDMPDSEEVSNIDMEWSREIFDVLALFPPESRAAFINYDTFEEIALALDLYGPQKYLIESIAALGGSIVTPVTAKRGDVVTVQPSPEPGYKLKAGTLAIDGQILDSVSFVMPDHAVKLTCEFERISFGVLVAKNEHSSVQLQKNRAAEGERVYFSIGTEYGYRVTEGSIMVNGVVVEGNSFVMAAQNAMITYQVEKMGVDRENGGWILWLAGAACVLALGGIAFIILGKRQRRKILPSEGE